MNTLDSIALPIRNVMASGIKLSLSIHCIDSILAYRLGHGQGPRN